MNRNPDIVKSYILHHLNISIIHRLFTLHKAYHRTISNERFWRRHVTSTLFPRYNDDVIEQIKIGNKRPWHSYALMFSPRNATEVYHSGRFLSSHDIEAPTPQPLELDDSVSSYLQQGRVVCELFGDDVLVVNEYVDDEFRIREEITNVARVILTGHRFDFLSRGGDLYWFTGKRHSPISIAEPIVALSQDVNSSEYLGHRHDLSVSTLSGRLFLITSSMTPIPIGLGGAPILKHSLVVFRWGFILYTVDVLGVLKSHEVVLDGDTTLIRQSLEIATNEVGRVVDFQINDSYSPYILLINDRGECHYRGSGRTNGLVTDNEPQKFIKLELPSLATRIAMRHDRVAIVLDDGAVLISGDSYAGALGIGEVERRGVVGPTFALVPEDEYVVDVSFTVAGTYFLCQ